jgi:SHS2 domain-containing protein
MAVDMYANMAENVANKKYEILEHPAELRIRIFGRTIEELFSNAALVMADTLSPSANRQAQSGKKEKIKIQSPDINSLLVDFLSEILAKSQINKTVYQVSSIRYQVLDKQAVLEAQLVSFSVDHFDEDIKAVTYQDLNIQKIDGIWQTILVFDI